MSNEERGRLYIVKELDASGGVHSERLVMAGSPASAVRYCAKDRFNASAAKAGEVARLMQAGAGIESASSE